MNVPDARVVAALAAVQAAMRDARDAWWVIGSAAVSLHGVRTQVADIDLLASEHDAAAVMARLGLVAERPAPHPSFRSQVFARWPRSDRDVEIMAGLSVAVGTRWTRLAPSTRVAIGGVFVPGRAELMSILAMFGRLKDLERRRLLAAL